MMSQIAQTRNPYLEEYSAQKNIRSYVADSAGDGIAYILENIYGPLYMEAFQRMRDQGILGSGVRLIEYGCGGGMNLIHLVKLLDQMGIPVTAAYGTDFSPEMIKAAEGEAAKYLTAEQREKVRFFVASNENLVPELSAALGKPASELFGTFHFIFGINTFRYCHRLKKEDHTAKSIHDLLVPGGTSLMIDMNQKFPFFRSRVHDMMTMPKEQYYLPSLESYTQPFLKAGFKILTTRNFCWIPHSAAGLRLAVCKALTPVLNAVVPSRAMRSLVIGVRER